jgi:ankyrin repeat protein
MSTLTSESLTDRSNAEPKVSMVEAAVTKQLEQKQEWMQGPALRAVRENNRCKPDESNPGNIWYKEGPPPFQKPSAFGYIDWARIEYMLNEPLTPNNVAQRVIMAVGPSNLSSDDRFYILKRERKAPCCPDWKVAMFVFVESYYQNENVEENVGFLYREFHRAPQAWKAFVDEINKSDSPKLAKAKRFLNEDEEHTENTETQTMWQTSEDLGMRRQMILRIINMLKAKKPKDADETWTKKLPDMARRLEELLYKRAPSKAAYEYTNSLKARLKIIAGEIAKKAKGRKSNVVQIQALVRGFLLRQKRQRQREAEEEIDALYEGVDNFTPSSRPLNAALEVKDEKKARALLDSGENPREMDNSQYNALHIAAREGCGLDLFSKILSKFKSKVNAGVYWHKGFTPLMFAVVNNHLDMVTALMQHPWIDLNVQNDDLKRTALHLAVYINHPVIVAQLLSGDIDTSLKDNTNATPLTIAIRCNYDECARILRRVDRESSESSSSVSIPMMMFEYIKTAVNPFRTSVNPFRTSGNKKFMYWEVQDGKSMVGPVPTTVEDVEKRAADDDAALFLAFTAFAKLTKLYSDDSAVVINAKECLDKQDYIGALDVIHNTLTVDAAIKEKNEDDTKPTSDAATPTH